MKEPTRKARGLPARPYVPGANPWKIVNPHGIRWANTFQTEAKAWTRIVSAHGMQDHPRKATRVLIDRGWKVVRM